MDWLTVVTSLGGSGGIAWLTVRGLGRYISSRWLANHKNELDKNFEQYRDSLERRRKRIEAELGHRSYIGKTQFDTEFNALKEIFAALGVLKLAMDGIRPIGDALPTDYNERAAVLNTRLHELIARFNDAVTRAASYYPFMSEEIYNTMERCLKAAKIEIEDIRSSGTCSGTEPFTPAWYQRGYENGGRFGKAYFEAAALARARFKELAVVSERDGLA